MRLHQTSDSGCHPEASWLDCTLHNFKILAHTHWHAICRCDRSAIDLLAEYRKGLLDKLAHDTRYLHALEKLKSPLSQRLWRNENLVHQTDLRAGLIKLAGGGELPLHDHPDCLGMVVLISGQLLVDRFDIDDNRHINAANVCTLRRLCRQTQNPGEVAWILPSNGNIHGLQCIGEQPCIFLDILISRNHFRPRSLFLPISNPAQEECVLEVCRVADSSLRLTPRDHRKVHHEA